MYCHQSNNISHRFLLKTAVVPYRILIPHEPQLHRPAL